MDAPRTGALATLLVPWMGLLVGLSSLSCQRTELSDGSGLFTASNGGALPGDPCPAPPFVEFAVEINEVMLLNETTLADESGEFAPWLEIYNPTGGEVYLGGATLSDDQSNEAKWEFPCAETSVIGPHEFAIVFLDGDTAETDAFHASFTPALGGVVTLILNGGSDLVVVDAVAPVADASVGRFPDGEGGVIPMDAPTPGAANIATLDVPFHRGDVDGDADVDDDDLTMFLELTHTSTAPLECPDRLDVNDDGRIDVSDGSFLARALAPGGPAIPAPHPDPGVDPTPDDLVPCSVEGP